MEELGPIDAPLRAARPGLDGWPQGLGPIRDRLAEAADIVLQAYDGLAAAAAQPGDMRSVFRAMGRAPRAMEALYPLAAGVPPISRFFLDPARRGDDGLVASLAGPPQDDGAPRSVLHGGGEPGARGAWSAYVPEYYTPDEPWPLVMALHGGAGNGRNFLWSWLRDARSFGAILIAPTAVGDTWSLQGPDIDTPNLMEILATARSLWNIDPDRLLLTGMSDGGTFSYVSGLDASSVFTHLAPACSSFHPVLAAMADPARLAGLPIHITHGVQDWMFSVDVAREAEVTLAAAGANVTYREVDGLGHTYPRELNPGVLRWLMTTDRQ
jgi:phospholipase/carboxylesterase